MNISENLTRIENAVNSIKLTARQKEVGTATNVDEVALLVKNLKSPVLSDPEYVIYDGSTAETPFLYGRDEIVMQITDIKEGVLATGYDYDVNYYWPLIEIQEETLLYHMMHSYVDGGGSIHYQIQTLSEPIDGEVHTWYFDYDRLVKDSSVIGNFSGLPDYSTRNFRGVFGRAYNIMNAGIANNELYPGKIKIYRINESYPKAKDASLEARLVNNEQFLDWEHYDGVLPNGLYGTPIYTASSKFTKYQNPYELGVLNIDSSTVAQSIDASTYQYYGFSRVNVSAYNAPAEPTYQEKTVYLDLNTIDSSIEPDSEYDGLSAVSIDASTLASQRTSILNDLLGIAGTSVVNAVIDETEAETILDELLEI